MKSYILVLAILLVGCGGAGDCPDLHTRTQIQDENGTYWMRCQEFTCPGYTTQRRCWLE